MNPLPDRPPATHACGVNLLGPQDECLLVKVRLWLFTLDGGVERFQIFLRVWHCVVCLNKTKKQRERSVSIDLVDFVIIFAFHFLSHTGSVTKR